MCGHSRHHAFRHGQPDLPRPHKTSEPEWARQPDLRASDAEREEIVTALRDHGGSGRLGLDELDERTERAYCARTRGELVALLRDLPPAPRAAVRVPRNRPNDLGEALRAYVLVNVLLVVIWAATGAEYFWPMWVILGWGIGLVPGVVAATARRGRPKRPTLTI